jgi:hypothetical protein
MVLAPPANVEIKPLTGSMRRMTLLPLSAI